MKFEVGFIVIWEVPVPVIFALVTSMISNVLSSEVLLIVIFPVLTLTISLKFKIIFEFLLTLSASSAAVSYTHLRAHET